MVGYQPPPAASDNTTGPSMEWIHRLYNKYLDFDWPKAQAHINRHRHYIATIQDEQYHNIHFSHTPSTNPNAIPLILIHGWPGSFFEFDRVVDPLTSPADPSQPFFHVVIPSLPGFFTSSTPHRRGWTTSDTARLYHKLMLSLGYHTYTAQAGDWGMFVARALGSTYPQHCKAVHLNFCPTPLPAETTTDLTAREQAIEARCADWLDNHLGYAVCMRSRPHTLGVSLYDNPAGILMWVGEKYLELSCPSSPSSTAHDVDAWDDIILTTVTLYVLSNSIMTSMLPYYENVKHAGFGEFVLRPENRIRCPMGYTSYLYDSRPGTRRGVERSGELVYYREVDEGGHFAALECPGVFVEDCRRFFGEFYRP